MRSRCAPRGVVAVHRCAGAGVVEVAAAVRDEPNHADRIAQDAILLAHAAADAFGVEPVGGTATEIENPTCDGGLGLFYAA